MLYNLCIEITIYVDETLLSTSDNNRIRKQLEDKEKRRKLLLKAREGGGRRKVGSTSYQRSQRKLAQQARRERQRMSKHKENIILKQKEVEVSGTHLHVQWNPSTCIVDSHLTPGKQTYPVSSIY